MCFVLQVSYEGFVDDVRVGDYLMVDGGMTIIKVRSLPCMWRRLCATEPAPFHLL